MGGKVAFGKGDWLHLRLVHRVNHITLTGWRKPFCDVISQIIHSTIVSMLIYLIMFVIYFPMTMTMEL